MSIGSRGTFDMGVSQARESQASTRTLPSEEAEKRASRRASKREEKRASKRDEGQGPVARSDLMDEDRRDTRRKTLVLGIALVVVGGISACMTSSTPMFVSPIDVIRSYVVAINRMWLTLTDPAQALTGSEIMSDLPMYYNTLTSTIFTFEYMVAGFMLALAGALYQNVFRNPIASPAMLGVSSGIQLGVAVFLLIFGRFAVEMIVGRYLFCYACVTVVLLVLFILARLMTGKGRPLNVVNMLLVGTIINQFIGVFVTYITWYVFDDDTYDVFMSMTSFVVPNTYIGSIATLVIGFFIAIVPVFLLRFRMNALNFDSSDMRLFGVNPARLQAMALVLGTIVMVTAQLQVGTVAMITLVVPHLARAVYGSEFRKQLTGTLLLGALVLLVCHIISVAFPYDGTLPLGVVVNLVLLPAFVWIIGTQQRRWN